jgi:hypothetical protein
MRFIIPLLLVCVSASATPQDDQEVEIVRSVLEDSPNISQSGKKVCVKAVEDFDIAIARLNGELFRMETHRELGYDVRHQDRVQIMVLIEHKTQDNREAMRRAAYRGEGDFCLDKMRESIKLARRIYDANLAYRKIDAR